MKRNNDHYYSGITSFEDIRLEKARLILKGKLMESKLNMDLIQLKETFSISAIVLAFARKFIPQNLTEILEKFLYR
jgi:hypothetical protein